jgi:hypothetical protein
MRTAARVVVLSMVVGVLGAADARAPDLANAPTGLAGIAEPRDATPLPRASNGELASPAHSVANAPASTSDNDFWLLSGVAVGLIAYQLRRKHRLLRPQPFQLRPDL